MTNENYTQTITVPASPDQVFQTLTKGVDKWWASSADDASKVGERSTFHLGKTVVTMLVTELVPGQRVVWECVALHVPNPNIKLEDEWVGTTMHWDIEPFSGGSRIRFEHKGLTPEVECFEMCKAGWDRYAAGSLKAYLQTGVGYPAAA